MTTPEYNKYLRTKEWKARADECKRLAGYKCNRCKSIYILHAHHKTYENIFNEKQEDLECLCHVCHSKEHNNKKLMHNYRWRTTMQKKKIKTINSKWLAYEVLNELILQKDLKSSDFEVFTILIKNMISNNTKRLLYSQSDFISSSRTVSRTIFVLKGLEIVDYESTVLGKDTKKQGFNRYWIHENFLETEDVIYKINWSKLK